MLELSHAAQRILEREREAISDLVLLLGRLDAADDDIHELKTLLNDLGGLFLLVVCGEYNAGKSSLLNALLGEKVMLEGVTPTTDRITIVSHGNKQRDSEEGLFILRREHPAKILENLALVDTPGTNAVIQKHQELTEDFIPRADLVLFVTSADRPYTESERQFMSLIKSWGKKVVLVVNKIDILDSSEEVDKVLSYVQTHAEKTLETVPEVFGVAAKDAFQAKQEGSSYQDTGLAELEDYINTQLAETERIKLKLTSPLGVAQRLTDHYQQVLIERNQLLEDDRRTLEEVDRQLAQFQREMSNNYENYLARIKTVLLEVERRGDNFFDDTVRLRKIFGLLNTEKIRESFAAEVVRGADAEVDRAVAEMVDWFIQHNLQLWEDIMAYVKERRKAGQDQIIGEIGGRFQYDREALIRNLSRNAEDVMRTYDEMEEGNRLADAVQGAIVQTGLMQVGGIGLGAAVVALVGSVAWDITGVMAGLTIAGLGLLVLPRQRRKAKVDLHNKMQDLRDKLGDNLSKEFAREMLKSHERLTSAISPYTRFVKSELGRLEELADELKISESRLQTIKNDITLLSGNATDDAQDVPDTEPSAEPALDESGSSEDHREA